MAKRANKDAQESSEDQEWMDMVGYGRSPLKGRIYTDDHLRIILSVGFCHSPGGERAPLARAARHLTISMTRIAQNTKGERS